MRIVIFTNGILENPEEEARRWIDEGSLVVAADGGTRYALEAGLLPRHVIGDLDSLSEEVRAELQAAGTGFHVHPPAKDETDLELALLWAAEQGAEEIVVLGAFGGRPDQELANLLLLALPEMEGLRVLIAGGAWTVRLVRSGETAHVVGHPGDTLSLVPLGGDAEYVTTEGLSYPLEEETLTFGPARGVSNVFEGEEVRVHVESGLLWAFHRRGA
ncbi:MAG: thiamine diphosphokinase [Anaerolineales bacterium]